ncbi:unnamed protein product [Closterium sp. Naga37s-1]|nr:unnamed protein product [Closterium sp. Naga37s-1]
MSSERSISPRQSSARLVASGIACCAGTWNAVARIPRRATICAAANADGRAWGEGDGGGEVAGGGRSGGGGEVEEGEGGRAVRQVSESAEGSRPVGVHFIGIGGSGLSALAAVALKQGYLVSGSDSSASAQLQRVQQHGAVAHVGHSAAHIDSALQRALHAAGVARTDGGAGAEGKEEGSEGREGVAKGGASGAVVLVVVVSSAVAADNVEVLRARELGVPV